MNGIKIANPASVQALLLGTTERLRIYRVASMLPATVAKRAIRSEIAVTKTGGASRKKPLSDRTKSSTSAIKDPSIVAVSQSVVYNHVMLF